MQRSTRFIQPDVLTRIANLELVARGVVEGFVAGLHRSPYKGLSTDFMEYRPYVPGDDLARLDWKLYARTDRYYVKEFEDETNTRLHLLIDKSASMTYGSGAVTKLRYAQFLAAALAYLMVQQRDAVSLTLFDDAVREALPARSTRSHLHALLTTLDHAEPGTRTDVARPLHELAERRRARGLVVLISDLLDGADALAEGLKHFRFRGHEVVVFHLLDPQEVNFDFTDMVEFEDLETGRTLLVDADEAKALYQQNLQRHQDALRRTCGLLGFDYEVVTTDRPLDFALFSYLAARGKRGMKRDL